MRPRALVSALIVLCGVAIPAEAQRRWGDSATMVLVDRAIARRARQLADSGLADYTARAHGYLTFLAQLGEGFPDPPKVVRTDELEVEVYWRAPDRSRQVIVGRRDTLLLPTDITYHRDHLAIIQNDFASIIRLGDGDEVRDVPHPLSAAGRAFYEFVVADSFAMRTNERAIDVIEVRVRPRDDRQPAAVGAVYVDRAQASVVRMAFSFTRAALRDRQLEDVSVILENGLVDGRFWLPRRQEIEIRRAGTWLDFPARGIIRGRWEVCCVRANVGLDSGLFAGAEVQSLPPWLLRRHRFEGPILAALPTEQQVATADDVRRVQEEARALVRATALARTEPPVLAARGVSDLVRVNRAEGLAVGAGLSRRLGGGFSLGLLGRVGTADGRAKGTLRAAWERGSGIGLAVRLLDERPGAGDWAEVSGVRNTIAAQEFGADLTDPYRVRGGAVSLALPPWRALRLSLDAGLTREAAVPVLARPARGRYAPAFAADPVRAARVTLHWRAASAPGLAESRPWRAEGTVGAQRTRLDVNGDAGWLGRAAVRLRGEREVMGGHLVGRLDAAALAGGGPAPRQLLAMAGGPVTAAGYGFHAFTARALAAPHLEWQRPLSVLPAIPLGRFGRLPTSLVIAPVVEAVWVDRPVVGATADRPVVRGGWHPAVGVAALGLFDLVRLDVRRGVRGGRWRFAIDLSEALWRVL